MLVRLLAALCMSSGLAFLPQGTLAAPAPGPGGDGDPPEVLAEGQTCADCHADLAKQTTVHNPVKEGICEVCHPSEGNRHSFDTPEDAAELCLVCHELEEPKQAHPPVAEGQCLICHDPHGSAQPRLLRAPAGETCGQCHDDVVEPAGKVKAHGAFNSGEGCAACHSGHGGSRKAFLRDDSLSEACARCHSQDIPRQGGPPLKAVSASVKSKKAVHGPAASGACDACHSPHGSPRPSLLTAEYPRGPYMAFSEEAYALCFQCHEVEPFDDSESTDTAFRDGDRNLHFLHVRRAKGRSCRLCHDPHAASSPGLIADEIPFGSWSIRVGYQRTEDGGRCGPGCHPAKTFRR